MSETKKFLLVFAAVSLTIWVVANVLMGPPGLSRGYLDENKAQHDHYLDIIKSNEYKLYAQRPSLNPDVCSQENIDFVLEYESNPLFQKEQRRIAIYGAFFEFFNMFLVLVLVWRFARKPVLALIDQKIADLRNKMESAANARDAAIKRKCEAENRVVQLPDEERRVGGEAEARMARESAEMEEANQRSLEIMARELADRKREEMHAAALLLKRELVNQALDRLVEACRAKDSPEYHNALIGQFANGLEKRS